MQPNTKASYSSHTLKSIILPLTACPDVLYSFPSCSLVVNKPTNTLVEEPQIAKPSTLWQETSLQLDLCFQAAMPKLCCYWRLNRMSLDTLTVSLNEL